MPAARALFQALLGARLPLTNTTLEVRGVERTVLIRRDRWGIPYVEAATDDDAWFGFGFAEAQDRAFQLEAMLRVVRGTLAELVGREMLAMDRLSRRIGFRRIGEAQLAGMDGVLRRQLDAFAAGVTEGARRGSTAKAHELALLFAEPTPYEAADVVGGAAFIAFALASNWDIELARLRMLLEDGPAAALALDPTYPAWLPVTHPAGAAAGPALGRLAEDLAHYQRITGGASNNWVIAPSRTKTGRPLLACDPHLPPGVPVLWYPGHVRGASFAVSGACMISQPGFCYGHNGYAAWGPTAGHHDNTDLFLEQVGPDGRSVRQGDGFVPCEVLRETIRVRGGADVVEEILVTPRGPILGPALPGELGAVSISIRATWMAARPYRAAYRIHETRSLDDLRALHDPYPGVALSYVYADAAGHVGWTLVGDAPRRRKGNGTFPLPGWDPEVGWEDDDVPMREMPHARDPEEGYLASSNNQPTPTHDAGEGPFLGVDWLDGYRQARITEALAARRDWDVEGVLALQLDRTTLLWRELRPVVLAVPARDPDAKRALSMLEHWSGVCSAESTAASVFELFLAEMIRRIVEKKAPRTARIALGEGPNAMLARTTMGARRISHLVGLIRTTPPGFFAHPWPDEMADALAAAVRKLVAARGPDPSLWAWGKVRPVTLPHFAGAIPLLGRVFNVGPAAVGGDLTTIPQASVDYLDPTGNPLGIVSMRMVIDVGAWDETRLVLAGGVSGNPLSPHYADMFPLWQRGESVRMPWSEQAVRSAAVSELTLSPAPG
jgi:penicillin amidase